MKGSYILVIHFQRNVNILVGALGKLDFDKGYYLYVGSAMGTKGSTTLENRVRRHISNTDDKKIYWHIDYLLANKNSMITCLYLIPSLTRLECLIANEILEVSDDFIPKFGSTDCECPSHLYYCQRFQGLNQISKSVQKSN